MAPRVSLEERFWSKVDQSAGADGCWIWRAGLRGTAHNAYGAFGMRRAGVWRNYPAHRVAYELAVGPIPVGLEIDHLCRNIQCVNPSHLDPVTRGENLRRRHQAVAASLRPRAPEDRPGDRCYAGHLYTAESTRINARGARCCRICDRERKRRERRRPAQGLSSDVIGTLAK